MTVLKKSINFMLLKGNSVKVFIYFFLIALLYIFPVILANEYYVDDLGRSIYGYTGWKEVGRPLADIILKIINQGGLITDISPLSQVITIGILSYALSLFAKKYFYDFPPYIVAGVLFLSLTSPLFLENLSYKFDSIYQSFSIVFVIVAFSLPDFDNIFFRISISIILLLFTLSTYQASLGIFLQFIVIESLLSMFRNKSASIILKNSIVRLGEFLSGCLLYKFIILPRCLSGDYAVNNSQTLNMLTNNGLAEFYHHYTQSAILRMTFHSIPKFDLICLGVIFCVFIYVFFIKNNIEKNSLTEKICKVIIVISLLFLGVIGLAPVMILKDGIFVPRVYISAFGIFLSISVITLYLYKNNKFICLFLIPYFTFAFAFSNAYGNVLNRQNEFDRYVMQSIAYDISHLENNNELKYLAIRGTIPNARELELATRKYPVMVHLIPRHMSWDWWWGKVFTEHYIYRNLKFKTGKTDFNNQEKPIVQSEIYNLYKINDLIVIDFTKVKR